MTTDTKPETKDDFSFKIGTTAWIAAAYVYYIFLEKDLHLLGSGDGLVYQLLIPAIGVVIYLGTIIAHEIGHAIAFTAAELRVTGITIVFWGGYTSAEDDSQKLLTSGKMEFWVAAAGPLCNLVIALLIYAFVLKMAAPQDVLNSFRSTNDLIELWSIFAVILNCIMFATNILPVFPYDGGKMARGVLMGITGNWVVSTVLITLFTMGLGVFLGWLMLLEVQEVGWLETREWWYLAFFVIMAVYASIHELIMIPHRLTIQKESEV